MGLYHHAVGLRRVKSPGLPLVGNEFGQGPPEPGVDAGRIARLEGRPSQAHRYPDGSSVTHVAPPPQISRGQGQGSASSSGSRPSCSAFNEGRCNATGQCPHGLPHLCSHCGGTKHTVKQCFVLFGRPPLKGGGKGSGAAAPLPGGKGTKKQRRGGGSEITSTTLDYTH